MIQPKIDIPKNILSQFCKKHFITKMSLFGSVLTDQFKPTSDVDFLVEFDPDHIPNLFSIVNIEEELSAIVGRKADLKTPNGLSRYFRDDVMKSALRVYE